MSVLHPRKDKLLDKRKPRYVLLAEEILAGIGDGVYPVGSLLPSEPQLCLQYQFSRHTVREAIRILQKMGVVSSRQGLGTRVDAEQVTSRYVHAFDAIPDLWEYAKNTKLRVMTRGVVDAVDVPIAYSETSVSAKWCMVQALRCGKPSENLAWTQLYFRAEYSGIAGQVGRRRVPLYALIAERYGVRTSAVRQEISGAGIFGPIAAYLKVKPGSVGIVMTRRYFDADQRLYEITKSIYPAMRFSYNVEFRLELGKDISG